MKTISIAALILMIGVVIGVMTNSFIRGGSELAGVITTTAKQSQEKQVLYWVAPMDSNFRRDLPGKSPMGMDLIPVYADTGSTDKSILRIAPEVVQNLGVRTAKVQRGRLSRRIDTVGYINYDESKISHIHLRADGWIHNLSVDAQGERVTQGSVLFSLYSPILVNAQQEYIQALATKNASLIRASEERLLALGLIQAQIDRLEKDRKPEQYVAIYAPQSGVVAKLNVRHGMYVRPENEIMSLAELDSVWIQAEVFERQANWVKVGQDAEAQLPSMPGHVWKGKVDYIYPELDPVTRTLRVRLRFSNKEEILKPNMYAEVSIFSELSKQLVHIPREALILDGKSARVIRALGQGRFQAREVIHGMQSDGRVEIIRGLNAGDDIVISAQFLIDSEASLKSSLLRMQAMDEVPQSFTGIATVNAVDTQRRLINISHGPIEALGWPAMTMDMQVRDDIDLMGLATEQRVQFELIKNAFGNYVISFIEPQRQEGGVDD